MRDADQTPSKPTPVNQFRADVTQRFFDELLRAVMNHTQPEWVAGYTIYPHMNPLTDSHPSPYRGVNTLQLAMAHMDLMKEAQGNGHGDFRWCTFNQMKRRRYGSFETLSDTEMAKNQYRRLDDPEHIRTWGPRKGTHATAVEFWTPIVEKKNENAPPANPDEEKPRPRFVSRLYKVFNFMQIDGAPPFELPPWRTSGEARLYEAAFRSIGIPIYDAPSDAPHYEFGVDRIGMPLASGFRDLRSYIHSLSHEFIHATGAENRLNRVDKKKMAAEYDAWRGEEEMIAEIGSMFLMERLGFEPMFKSTVPYVLGWQKRCSDPHALPRAFRQAQAATEYILNAIAPEFRSIIVEVPAAAIGMEPLTPVDPPAKVGLSTEAPMPDVPGMQEPARAMPILAVDDRSTVLENHAPLSTLVPPF